MNVSNAQVHNNEVMSFMNGLSFFWNLWDLKSGDVPGMWKYVEMLLSGLLV